MSARTAAVGLRRRWCLEADTVSCLQYRRPKGRQLPPQASGEATFTSDIGVGSAQLYAATVASTHAHAHITKIDLAVAEKVLHSTNA